MSRLGAGAVGEVHLAADARLHRHVAIKTLLVAPDMQAAREALLREARAAAGLSHSAIAAVFDVIEQDGKTHLVMEYVPGETLAATLRHGGLPPLRAIELAQQIADGLACAHRHGVLHCDLKPANIVITPDGIPKILDFGLSRLISGSLGDTTAESASSGHKIRGTLPYMAPELFSGVPADACSDVYSLGVTMYEMVTGRRPYEAPDLLALARAIVSETPAPLSSSAVGVPRAFEEIVSRAMARERQARYASAADVGDALGQVLRRETHATTATAALPVPRGVGARRGTGPPGRVVAAITMGLVLTVGLLLWALRPVAANRTARVADPVLAILPDPLAGDESEPLTRGFADLLAADLRNLPGIVVASAPERIQAGVGPADLARQVGASYVLQPAVARTEGTVRVSLVLRTVDGNQRLWSNQLSGRATNILAIQKQMVDAVVPALVRRGFLEESPSAVTTAQNLGMTADIDAYAEYSQGRTFESRPDVPDNLERAVGLFERALARDPDFAQARASLGRVSLALYTSTRSRAWLDRAQKETIEALRLAPDSIDTRYAVAVLYAQTGQEETARRELVRLVERDPENDDAHRLLGLLLAESGDLPAALTHLERARRLRPGYWDNHRALGLAYFDAGRYADAVSAFQRLTELQPDSAWGFQTLGTAYHAAGDRRLALENYRKALVLAPSARSHSNIGTLLYEEGQFAGAIDAYRQAIALRPNQPVTHRNLADALLRLGNTAEASAAYRTALAFAREELSVRRDDPNLLALQAYCLARLGQVPEAVALSARAAALAPSNNAVQYEHAVILAIARRPCDALAALRSAVETGYSIALVGRDHDLGELAGHSRFDALVGPTGRKGKWATVKCDDSGR